MKPLRIAAVLALALGGLAQAFPEAAPALADDEPSRREAEASLRKLQLAPGLRAGLFALEPAIVNPVALAADERGRLYVVETHRYRTSTLDIRHYMDWLEDDLACRTVEDRVALCRRRLGDGAARLAGESERIRRLEDRDGDGRADDVRTFAEGFDAIADGVAAGVLPRGRDVWFASIPSLWRLRDEDGDGHADGRRVLHTGYGVHFSLTGHDLHGLCLGPDGKLYFSIGDRGFHVETEGRVLSGPDEGAVFRCNPDGSGLEIFATGLRNPQDLAFDAYGNLWTGDNNSNNGADTGETARILHVVEGGDYGWRIGYQMAPDGGPWLKEDLWKTAAPYMVPQAGHLGHGPAGLAFYPGTGLPDRYRDRLFLCDFPGGVHAFSLRPRGVSYEIGDRERFLWELLPTDIEFGPDGGVYVLDWVEGWFKTGKGRMYRVVDPERIGGPEVRETRRLLADGMGGRPKEELAALLGHVDRRVRQEAQFELAARGAKGLPILAGIAAAPGNRLARLHAVWGLGQAAALEPQALAPVLPLLKDSDEEVRAQAARVLGDRRAAGALDGLVATLRDANPRVRFFAALGLGKLGRPDAVKPVLEMIRENDDRDAFLRHAGVMALAGVGAVEPLVQAAADTSASVRMAALLALRRLRRPEIRAFLHDSKPALILEAARGIHDVPIPEAMASLAELPAHDGLPAPVAVRAVNARFRRGAPEDARALAAAAANEAVGVEALRALGAWAHPPALDRVLGSHRPAPAREAAAARDALAGPALSGLLHSKSDAVRVEAAHAAAALGLTDAAPVLAEVFADRANSVAVRAKALRALTDLQGKELAGAVAAALKDPDPALRAEALGLVPRAGVPGSAALLERAVESEATLALRQAAVAALGELKSAESETALAKLVDAVAEDRLPIEMRLDALDAAARNGAPALRARLARYESTRAALDLANRYREVLAGGDFERGRKIVYYRGDAACLRCHRIEPYGGNVGPELTKVAARLSPAEILESILEPSRRIAPGYEQVVLTTTDELIEAGRLERETKDEIVLALGDGTRKRIAKADIASRASAKSGMPDDIGGMLSRRDLRDVVTYLSGLGAADKTEGSGTTSRPEAESPK